VSKYTPPTDRFEPAPIVDDRAKVDTKCLLYLKKSTINDPCNIRWNEKKQVRRTLLQQITLIERETEREEVMEAILQL